ncbi:DnaD domain protein [Candidatus Soleaferrea massiliensis]|uniref:DnaD domain protein n=1 Tax=Candidatus Soleaferrea massiliensis TaxID=1470354 RepID=UPI0018CF2782|nr:DnaD domain protein [Candidatus Soleaferrea massiliensis]
MNLGLWNSVFAVPTALMDRYLKSCDGAALKVLLLILRNASGTVDTAQLSEQLGISQQQADEAVQFWANENILLLNQAPVKVRVQKQESPPAQKKIQHASGGVPPKMSQEELRRCLTENKDIKFLLQECERLFTRPLTGPEMQTLVGLSGWAGIHPDIILMVVQYCKELGKTNMRYVERTALDWLDKGIDTHEKAENHIRERTTAFKHEGLVKSALGIHDRSLIPKERQYIRSWFEEMGFDIRLIKLSYERTIEKIGKLSFDYMNAILTSWKEKGLKTPEQVMRSDKPPEQGQQEKKTSFDLDEFDKISIFNTPKL